MADLGTCWSCTTDLTMPSTMASGNRAVAEAIVRRWQTPRGGLIDDPNYGYALTNFVGVDLEPADIARIAHNASAEALKDERVLRCDVTITMVDGTMIVSGTCTTGAGPFRLVVSVSKLSVTLLQVA
jgi:phage baseplate assembly protein W